MQMQLLLTGLTMMQTMIGGLRLVDGEPRPDTLAILNLADVRSLRNFTRLTGMHLANGPDSLMSAEETIRFLDALKVGSKQDITVLKRTYKITNTETCIVSVITVTTDGTRQMILRTTGTPESGHLTLLVHLPNQRLRNRLLTTCGILPQPSEVERPRRSTNG